MKKTILIFSFIGYCLAIFSQNQICVDGSSSGNGNGTPSNPYNTIQKAVEVAVNGDVIKVAKGTYSETVRIENKKVQLLGGFAGNGNFDSANPEANKTIIKGTNFTVPCIYVSIQGAAISGSLFISGFTIREGKRGIELADGWSSAMDNITIENNIIENNGTQAVNGLQGGGISIGGSNITIKNNIIRNNEAGRGAAIGRTDKITNFLIENNRIENNTCYGDHAGGIDIHGTGTITQNIFDGNVAAKNLSWGWGGAVLTTNEDTTKVITLSYNVYRNNHAPDRGGAVFVDDGSKVIMEHEVFYNNTTGKSGSAIYVDADGSFNPSVLYMNHCTFSGNTSTNGAALFVQSSITHVQNCIFWNNGNDFETIVDDNGQAHVTLTVNFTLTQQGFTGTGNISSDPFFADATNGDFHLKSKAGRFHSGQWVIDNVSSPAIDAGNPLSPFANEPAPNGGRVNLGCYGNTAEASKSGEVSIEEIPTTSSELQVYPNPTTGKLRILMNNEQLIMNNIEIYDIYGRKLLSHTANRSPHTVLDVSHLPAGMYFIKVGTQMAKFVKQ